MSKAIRIAQIGKECVACGCCVLVCPRGAAYIHAGVTAKINDELCIGCGQCAKNCPAAVITIVERRAEI